jgi:Na+-driven multidrug efflux pump
VVAIGGLGSVLILVAYGHRFHPAVAPMLVLLPAMWLLGIGIVIQGDLEGRGRPGLSSALAGLATGVTAVLDFVLIPSLGVIGAALAAVAAYSTFGVASVLALRRLSGIPVRELVVPTRADLASYWQFIRGAAKRLRGSTPPP